MKRLHFILLLSLLVLPIKLFEFALHYPKEFEAFFTWNPFLMVLYNLDNILLFNTAPGYEISIFILIFISIWRFKYIGMSGWYALGTFVPIWNIYLIYQMLAIKDTDESDTNKKKVSSKNKAKKQEVREFNIDIQDVFLSVIIIALLLFGIYKIYNLISVIPKYFLVPEESNINSSIGNNNLYSNSMDSNYISTTQDVNSCGDNSFRNEDGTCSCLIGYEWEEYENETNLDCIKLPVGNPDSKEIWIDNMYSLMWQITPEYVESWYEANDKANNSVLAGYTDWRLPTSTEIRRLYSCSNYNCYPKKDIKSPYNGYWTGTDRDIEFYGDAGKMYLKADEGIFPGMYLSSPGAVRIVRDL